MKGLRRCSYLRHVSLARLNWQLVVTYNCLQNWGNFRIITRGVLYEI